MQTTPFSIRQYIMYISITHYILRCICTFNYNHVFIK